MLEGEKSDIIFAKEQISKGIVFDNHRYWWKFDYSDGLLRFVETRLAGAFFPTPGPIQIPESSRRQGIQDLLDMYAPTMTINELYEGADPKKVRWPVLK